jgi:hypothetical protein
MCPIICIEFLNEVLEKVKTAQKSLHLKLIVRELAGKSSKRLSLKQIRIGEKISGYDGFCIHVLLVKIHAHIIEISKTHAQTYKY